MLLIILVVMVVLSSLVLLLGKDVVQKEPEAWGYYSIRDVDVKPIHVTSSEVVLNVTVYIDHSGAKTKNASMLMRAISADTGLLATQDSKPLPSVEEDSKTITVSQELKVERSRGYEIRMLLFDNGRIVESGLVGVKGIEALEPEVKRVGIDVKGMDFIVRNVSSGVVRIQADLYLENRGPSSVTGLGILVKAREASSNLLSDKVWIESGEIKNETTIIRNAILTVPDEYNYMVEAMVWRGDVLIGKWEKPILLAPTKTLPKETVEKKVELEVSKFVREEKGVPAPIPGVTPTPLAPKAPGFEMVFSLLALILVVLFIRRSRYGR